MVADRECTTFAPPRSGYLCVAWWRNGQGAGLATPEVAGSTSGLALSLKHWSSCSLTCTSVTNQYNWYRSRGGDALLLGR